jgi:hypothetical protein
MLKEFHSLCRSRKKSIPITPPQSPLFQVFLINPQAETLEQSGD